MVCQQCICNALACYGAGPQHDIRAGATGNELVQELDERAFSFFNAILDDAMRTASASPASHESLGHALDEAMAKAEDILIEVQSSATEGGAGAVSNLTPISLPSAALAHGSDLKAAVMKHMRPGDGTPCSAFRRAVYWHWANLEYGCSADLDQVKVLDLAVALAVYALCQCRQCIESITSAVIYPVHLSTDFH